MNGIRPVQIVVRKPNHNAIVVVLLQYFYSSAFLFKKQYLLVWIIAQFVCFRSV